MKDYYRRVEKVFEIKDFTISDIERIVDED